LGAAATTDKKQILKSASLITVITIASRILGYVRDQRITLLLGTTLAADSFVLAYRIPNLLRRLVGEGSMTASFIPVFTTYLTDKSKEEVWDFACRLFWTLAVLLALLTVAGMLFSSQLIHLFTFFGNAPKKWDQAVELNRIIFPYAFFIGLAALAMAILNCFHVFGLPASTPILLNIAIITCSTGAVWPYFHDPAKALSVGVVIGGALQLLVQIPALVRQGMRFQFGISFTHPGIRTVGRLMVPGFFGIGIAQINMFIDTVFCTAAKMPAGSVTALYVADRVMEMVLGGYAIAVATAILPMMSRQAASHDYDTLKKTFGFSLRIVSYVTIPAMVGLIILRVPIIRVLFEHGRFAASSTELTARALLYLSLGLPAMAAVKLLVPAFYSSQDTRTPVTVAFYAMVVNIFLNAVFLKSFFQTFQNAGPALATSIAAGFNFTMLFIVFRQRFGRLGTFTILFSMGKMVVASGVMGAVCYAMLHFSKFESRTHLLPQIALLVGMITSATLIYIGITWLLRCPEVEEVWGVAMRTDSAATGLPPA
jgi:putative peptidoglycan lipid II flippase